MVSGSNVVMVDSQKDVDIEILAYSRGKKYRHPYYISPIEIG